MSATRYIRLVDGQPTQARYTCLSNVTSSIEVSMELEPALSALERRPFPVPLVGMPAHRTLLRSVPGIHQENLLPECLGLVPEELLQFVERPGVQLPVERFAAPFLDTDLAQILESEDRKVRIGNLLRDTMVGVSHKPSFPSGNPAEFPRCRPGCLWTATPCEDERILPAHS